MIKGYTIAIDGPVAAGKGTVASLLANKLHGFYLYTGAMYRCLALYCLDNNINLDNKKEIIEALLKITIELDHDKVELNGQNVTERIKQRDVTTIVPKVAAIREVREEMVRQQRKIGLEMVNKGYVVITEGRDAATKIFPDAKLKIFLTASPKARAKRRYEQMGGANNSDITLDAVVSDTIDRDYKDMHRAVDPLVSDPEAFGYFVLDDTGLTEEKTLDIILEELKKRI